MEPPDHPFEIVEKVKVNTTQFAKPKSKNNELKISDFILSTSPSQLKTGFKNRGTIKKMKLKLKGVFLESKWEIVSNFIKASKFI